MHPAVHRMRPKRFPWCHVSCRVSLRPWKGGSGGWPTWTRIPWYTHSQKSSKEHRNIDWKRSSSIPGNQLFTRKERGKNGSGRQKTETWMKPTHTATITAHPLQGQTGDSQGTVKGKAMNQRLVLFLVFFLQYGGLNPLH